MRIVLVEDNEMLASGITKTLRDHGHMVEAFTDGLDADAHLEGEGADIAILDFNLPGIDGVEITKRARSRAQDFPIIMLTARGETEDRVRGLDAGADDYLVKPFAMQELEARIRALARRRSNLLPDREAIGALTFDRTARRLFQHEEELDLSRRELTLFETLLDRQGQFISKSALADTLYGVGADIDMNAVELLVSRLRRHLKASGVTIRTARGIGYMMDQDSAS